MENIELYTIYIYIDDKSIIIYIFKNTMYTWERSLLYVICMVWFGVDIYDGDIAPDWEIT